MKDKPGFCYEIVKNLAFWSHNKDISYNSCSYYDGFIDKNVTVDQAWHGHNRKKIIEIVSQGSEVPGCHRCYKEESNGSKSRRQSSLELYETFLNDTDLSLDVSGPTGLDYSVGNWCNLKCVICGPDNSSSWISDYKKMYPLRDSSRYVARKTQTLEIQDDNVLSNVKSIHFHGGGEPLLSDAHIKLLQRIDQVKGLADIRVFYNTNGTVKVSDEVLQLWEKCRLIELYFSIDDVGTRFEYQRTGADWAAVTDNIQWYYHNMPHNHMFNINCVWGYLNLYYLDELSDWYQQHLSSNRYGDPCNLIFQSAIGSFGIKHLDPVTLSMLSQKFKHYPSLLKLLDGIVALTHPHNKFWQAIDQIDNVRNTNFKDLCPEWSRYL